METNSTIVLKPGREKSLLRRHPWLYTGAVQKVYGSPQNGEVVKVVSSTGEFLAWGGYNSKSQICIRVWSWAENQVVDSDFIFEKLRIAILYRQETLKINSTNSIRIIHSESDGIPGLIVDQYNDCLVIQFLSGCVERFRDQIISHLQTLTGVTTLYERSDVEIRKLEGLNPREGFLTKGFPFTQVQIKENEINYYVDFIKGQKTGFYLDQSDNRIIARKYAHGRDVLDCFCYTGGFSINAYFGGAQSITAIEASPEAISLFKENIKLNNIDQEEINLINGDVFTELRNFRDKRKEFDLIILDPPKFAASISQVNKAARGYKDINLLAFKLLRPGGLLITFSCSGGVSLDLFQKIIAGSALDAGVHAQIIHTLTQAEDHPIALNFPESAYLKGFVIYVQK